MAYQNNIASRIISSVNITSGAASAQSSAAPFGATIARIATSANVNIVIGPSPTATAAGTLITPADASYFVIKPASSFGGTDGEKVASIGTATVNVTWLEG
jgi:hypothetical protein|tara:strand:+ start:722 stop:1024 length:303 start_codon:yes stop_codon:yes gene_type:complete